MPVPPSRSLEGFVSVISPPGGPPVPPRSMPLPLRTPCPSLLFWLWGTDHGLAHAEVESLSGQPAYSLARGLVASHSLERQPLARLAFTRVVFECLGRSDDLTLPFEPEQIIRGTFAVRAHVPEAIQAGEVSGTG